MTSAIRSLVRDGYRAAPFKRELFHLLRPLGLPEPVWRHLHFRGVISVEVAPGRRFRIMHWGNVVENDLFWAGYGEHREAMSLRLWRDLAARARCVYDVGANTGVFALAARAVNPTAAVVAFEPVSRVYDRLAHNAALNGNTLRLEKLAASDHTGEAVLYDKVSEHTYSATLEIAKASADPTTITIRTVRLDDYAAQHGETPDLIKIDVELHEPAVFRGMAELLKTRPVILVEVLREPIAEAINDQIAGLGYAVYLVHDDGAPERVERVERRKGVCNVLLLPPGADLP